MSNDPNKTVMGGPTPDPNRTVLGGPVPNLGATQMMAAPPAAGDPNKTGAWSPGKPLIVTVTNSRLATMANGPAREQFLLEITAPNEPGLPGMSVGSGPRTPLNLCLVIDRSGSMEGAPLEYAKQACGHVVDLLSPNDVLSIVLFDEVVEVLMAPQRVTDKAAVKAGIAQLTPGYTTNLFDGLTLAAQQLGMTADPNRVTRMVVLTDGEPTAGIKEFAPLVAHAGEIRQKGITCTFLGFGPDYNEELLASMAKKSGGNHYYIPQPQMIPQVFDTELAQLMTVTSTQLKLSLKFARWVNLKGCTGHTLTGGEREVNVDLADMERGATMQVVVDLEFPNHPLGHYRVAGGKLSYTSLGGATEVVDVDCVMEFTADAARYSVAPDARVAAAAEVNMASRLVEKTIMGLKTQAITAAVAMADLQKTQALLLSQGRQQEAREVTLAIQAIQSGNTGHAEKTLMGTVVQLDQGKTKGA
ncbi:MAG: VWA domain-containing protein [Fimbriimonadaceae bacterium]|nr:VWA domain-containing protein [Fimbriimonadaceae bacterium]